MFKKFLCYDPNIPDASGNPPASTMPEPVKFSVNNPPKTKEDWNKLATDDPTTWINLTQQNTDRMVRENRELQEKLQREQQEKHNLTQEVNRYKTPPVDPNVPVPYSVNNYPKNQQEWDSLFLENPTFATDLRQNYNNQQISITKNFESAQANYRKEVQAEHPDMYLIEFDPNGQPLKDEHGKLVLKKGPNGEPLFNASSEKGKLWEQIYNESTRTDGTNPLNYAPNAPRLMQAELERRLRQKGQSMIQSNEPPKQNQVAAPGVPPPVAYKGEFKSTEERQHVEKAIQRGIYTNVDQYFKTRDGGSQAIYDTNRRPDFSRK